MCHKTKLQSTLSCELEIPVSVCQNVLASSGDSRIFQGTEQLGDRQPDKLIKPLAQARP